MKLSQTLGVILGTTTLAMVQYQTVSALTAVEVNDIAKPITVMIGGLDGKGSGVIIAKDGNTYTVLTANHVVKKAQYGLYEIITHDGQKYQMENKAQILGKLDLALVRFTSSKNYLVAKIADSRTVKQGTTVYISGFPFPSETNNQQRNYFFLTSEITAKGKGENLGYDLFLSGGPRPGISGSPILNDQGEVIGIYGKAEYGKSEGALSRDGVQGIPTEKFPNLISNIQNNIPDNTQVNIPGNNSSSRTESTPVIFQKLEALLKAGKWKDA
ncbi:MAG: serine protease, partial [Dolichospermum sp.]